MDKKKKKIKPNILVTREKSLRRLAKIHRSEDRKNLEKFLSSNAPPDGLLETLRAEGKNDDELNALGDCIPSVKYLIYLDLFNEQLLKCLEKYYMEVTGMLYHLSPNKIIKIDGSVDGLIENAVQCDQLLRQNVKICKPNFTVEEGYDFLKKVFERDCPFPEWIESSLKIKVDTGGLSIPEKNAIAIQIAAQILWFIEGNRIPTIEKMEAYLLDKDRPFFELLDLNRFEKKSKSRTIQNWVRIVFPVPPEDRKRKLPHKEGTFLKLVHIPGIVTVDRMNFRKLVFAIRCITLILKRLGWNRDQIKESRFIHVLRNDLKVYVRFLVSGWVDEAFEMNGSIFPSEI